MFDNILREITRKFLDIKLWLSNINMENEYYLYDFGLYFVYVYGVYEETVRQVVSATISEINDANVKIGDCIYDLYAVALSPEYDGLYNVGNNLKWNRRWDISNKLKNNQSVSIPSELFPTDGKNLRYSQLESIAKSFGVNEPVLPRKEIGGYLTEMVDNRNYISHGNKTPKEVGRNYSRQDLLDRCDYISEICLHIVNKYKDYVNEKKYLK